MHDPEKGIQMVFLTRKATNKQKDNFIDSQYCFFSLQSSENKIEHNKTKNDNIQQVNTLCLLNKFVTVVMIQSSPVTTPRQRTLQKFLKQEKTTAVEYTIIQSLLAYLQTSPQKFCQEFFHLYQRVLPEMRRLTLFQYLNFQLWNDTDMPKELRDKTEFFSIVSEWIISYEMKQQDLKDLRQQLTFVREFIEKNTVNMFQRVVLFEEIHEDLISLFGRKFWGNLADFEEDELDGNQSPEDPANRILINKLEAEEVIKLISTITSYFVIHIEKMGHYINCSLNLISENHSEKYKIFIETAIKNVLSVNQPGNSEGNLDSSQENQITRISLIYLQRPDIEDRTIIDIVKMLMLKTCKMVRYAMIIDYIRFYEYLERTARDAVLEELQDIVYFRELIIGRNQIEEAGLLVHTLGPTFEEVNIAAGARHRIMYSHEEVYGEHSLLQIQVQIQGGDINLIIYHYIQGREKVYWRQDRTEDRRVDIILQKPGIYIVELDNSYSWVKGKKILYKIEQFGKCP